LAGELYASLPLAVQRTFGFTQQSLQLVNTPLRQLNASGS
jgi:hypothetical protein